MEPPKRLPNIRPDAARVAELREGLGVYTARAQATREARQRVASEAREQLFNLEMCRPITDAEDLTVRVLLNLLNLVEDIMYEPRP